MSDNVVQFTGVTFGHIPPEQVLEEAKNASLRECLVIGYEADTGDVYFSGSLSENPEILFMLELAKQMVMTASASWTVE